MNEQPSRDDSKPVDDLDGPPTKRIRTPLPSKAPEGAGQTEPPKPPPVPMDR